jgi:hypothetical protein
MFGAFSRWVWRRGLGGITPDDVTNRTPVGRPSGKVEPRRERSSGRHPMESATDRSEIRTTTTWPKPVPKGSRQPGSAGVEKGSNRRDEAHSGVEVPRPAHPSRGVVDLIIGLDFGTAGTKVVVRSAFLPGSPARAIAFGNLGHVSSKYLLPSRVRLGAGGHLFLQGESGMPWITDLKVRLMKHTADDLVLPVAYLALVIHDIRARFLEIAGDAYKRFDIRWSLNLGIPSAGYDDLEIRRNFLRAARAGWWLSMNESEITSSNTEAALAFETSPSFDPGISIEVIPEVVAQALGYARSHLRERGLHVMVDVGATTLDVCGFVLHDREGQDRYELLTTTVDRLGTSELHRRRLAALRCGLTDGNGAGQISDALLPLPVWPRGYHGNCACNPPDVDHSLQEQATRIVMRHLLDLRRRRDPHSPRWQTGLPVFLCGGGSGITVFDRAVSEADWRLRSATRTARLVQRRLPQPEDLVNDDIPEELFHRLSVAYGLSFVPWDTGKASPPHEIDDIVRPDGPRDIGDGFVSKDQV